MTEWPYGTGFSFTQRDTFEVLSKYFKLVDDYETKEGIHIFLFDENVFRSLTGKTLCEVAVYTLLSHNTSFAPIEITGFKDNFSTGILKLITEKGITPEWIRKNMFDFEIESIGNASAWILELLCSDLERGYAGWVNSFDNIAVRLREDHKQQKSYADKLNQGKENPFNLEGIIDIEASPVALTHDSKGRLYVLDSSGKLYQIEGLAITKEWKPEFDYETLGVLCKNEVSLEIEAQPSIAVEKDILFLTTGYDIQRHDLNAKLREGSDLTSLISLRRVLAKSARVSSRELLFHNVVLKEGNVLASVSQGLKQFIFQITEEGERLVYNGEYPIHQISRSLDDITLRLGVFKAGLYLPRSTGLSLYTSDGPKEMLGEYINPEHPYSSITPITKFSFGDDFLVAIVELKGSERPLLCTFFPEYQRDSEPNAHESNEHSESLVKNYQCTQCIQPERFKLAYGMHLPKFTGSMTVRASLSGHQNQFALSDPFFNKVMVYSRII